MAAHSSKTVATEYARAVETDLPCAGCGYNLRTLSWDSVCPECSTPVLRSGRPVGFRFSSPTIEKRVRWGIGILAVALLIEVVGRMAMTLAFCIFFVAPRSVYWAGWYAWVYGEWLMSAGILVAALLIVQPFAPGQHRFKPRLARVTAILVLGGTLHVLFELTTRLTNISPYQSGPIIVFNHLTWLCTIAAYVLTCGHVLLRIDRKQHRVLWTVLLLVVAAQTLVLYGPIVGPLLYFTVGTAIPPASAGHISAPWRHLVVVDLLWWHKHVVVACWASMLFVLLLVLRRLHQAQREPS